MSAARGGETDQRKKDLEQQQRFRIREKKKEGDGEEDVVQGEGEEGDDEGEWKEYRCCCWECVWSQTSTCGERAAVC